MQITREFLTQEMIDIEHEMAKAKDFLTKSEAVLNVYRMLVMKLDAPEETQGAQDGIC